MAKITGNEQIQATIYRKIGDNEFRLATPKDLNQSDYLKSIPGLTIRQYFAGQAMQGLLTNYIEYGMYGNNSSYPTVAEAAVACADALIAELNKSEE